MSNLKIVYTEFHKIVESYTSEIDLSSSAQWTALIEKVRSRIDDDDSVLDDFPTEPSDNLEDWLFLYFFLNPEEYSQKIDLTGKINIPLRCERVWSIQNQAGEILIEDRWPI
ncbi:MAG: hypothetical protein EBS66_16965 [Betaproteobacteria bacterium]|nr:hypothetical protein [Betaproteobacteria bacterium]